MRSHVDGRGRVDLLPDRITAAKQRRIEGIARALGYQVLIVETSVAWASGSSSDATTARSHAAAVS